MYKSKKIIVVLPAYNAASTLERTINDLPEMVDQIILVDDKSNDETAALARSLGLMVYEHDKNKGYGAAQKTGFKAALLMGANAVVMLHGDNQYDPGPGRYPVMYI